MATKIKTALLILSMAALGSTALASPKHLKADTNNDGQISFAEFSALRAQGFTDADNDADNVLSKDERKTHRQHRRESKSQQRQAKMQEHAGKHFDLADTDGDGSLSRSEYEAGANKRKEKMKSRKHMRKARKHAMKSKKHADTNQDGFVDRSEFDIQTQTIFSYKDRDGDGFLSKSDMETLKHGKLKRFDNNQ